MSKILFSNAYFYRLDSKQWESAQPYPPLGTLQAVSYVRQAGFAVDLFDACLAFSPEDVFEKLQSAQPDIFVIYDDGFNYLTKMCLTVMRDAAMRMIQISKSLGIPVIVCSSDAHDHYEKYLHSGADYVIRGEGEVTLVEVLQKLDSSGGTDQVEGLVFKSGDRIQVNPSRAVLRDLDQLPLPAWNLVDLEAYKQIWNSHHGYFSLNIATTRGCPFKCNWCAKPIYGNRYNTRSSSHVVDEIQFLINHARPDHFWMCDDIFGLKPGWVKSFNEEVRRRGLSFKYKIQSRVDLLLEHSTLEALARSGLDMVWLGAESGSQKILDAMEKGTTVSQIYEVARLLRSRNIRFGFFLQFGYPGESMHDIQLTLKMVLDLLPDEIGVSVSYPLPGTAFYDRVKSSLAGKQNWTDSDELAMMHPSPYPPEFYKILHRYVHHRYRIHRGFDQMRRIRKSGITMSRLRGMASMIYNIPQSLFRAWQLNRLSHETL